MKVLNAASSLLHNHHHHHHHQPWMIPQQPPPSRFFCAAVKELPWCAPKDSPNRRRRQQQQQTQQTEEIMSSSRSRHHQKEDDRNESLYHNKSSPVSRFGIIAAMCSKTRIIGVNGDLPWNIPQDRAYFEQVTADSIFILGRHSLYEGSRTNLSNVAHVRKCIVVSTTLTQEQLKNDFQQGLQEKGDDNFLSIARSFPEALYLANKQIIQEYDDDDNNNYKGAEQQQQQHQADNNNTNSKSSSSSIIRCWIGGGERIYSEAVTHPSAEVIHLTMVDNPKYKQYDADANAAAATTTTALFPAKYRWDHKFKLQSTSSPSSYMQQATSGEDTCTSLSFYHCVYRRIRPKRNAASAYEWNTNT